MLRKLLGRISRWVRRISYKYCTIDIDKDARGLAECLVDPPLTKWEKSEQYRQQLLRNIKEDDQGKVIKHFNDLSKETDPLEDIEEIPNDSVKTVGMNIAIKDVQTRAKKICETNDKKKAEMAIRGLGEWPVPLSDNTKRKN